MQQIIEQVLNGDREAYRRVVEHYQDGLLAYAGFRLPDRDAVDEVVQRTFIRAYEQLDRFEKDKDMGAWLRAICRYMIMDELQKGARAGSNRNKYKEYLQARLCTMAMEPGRDPGDADLHAVLRKCLGGLEETARSLIASRYTKSRSVKEIASELGRTITWVTSTLHRTRAALRTCIEKTSGAEPSS